jgi:hypothetical protein
LNPNTNGRTATEIDLSQDPLIPIVNGPATNAFCAGHSQAADGSVWVIGGDAQDSNNTDGSTFMLDGRDDIRKYIPITASDGTSPLPSLQEKHGDWDVTPGKMTGGYRWYPTVVTMADGE